MKDLVSWLGKRRLALQKKMKRRFSRYANKLTFAGLMAVVLFCWASAYVAIRYSLVFFSTANLAFLRYLVTSAGFGVLALVTKIKRPALRDLPMIVLAGLAGYTLYSLLLNTGEQIVSAGIASFIINLVPFFTMLLVILSKQETVKSRDWMGMIISFSGVAVIIFMSGNVAGFNINVLYILGAAFCQALYYVIQKSLLGRYSPLEITSYGVWVGTLILFFFSTRPFEAVSAAPPGQVLSVLYLGVFPGMVANLIMAYALQKDRATNVSTYLFLIPFITLLLGWALLDEVPSFWAILAGSLIVIGILIKNKVIRGPGKVFKGGGNQRMVSR
jgi:drug/metabolite transporter (DMT)-like permease